MPRTWTLRLPTPIAPDPKRETVLQFLERVGWSEQQYSAARSLGFPAPMTIWRERTGQAPQSYAYVKPDAVREWQRDFALLIAGSGDRRSLAVLTFAGEGTFIEVEIVRKSLNLSQAQFGLATQWFRFPVSREQKVHRNDGRREYVPVVNSNDVDRWLECVRALAPGFGCAAEQPPAA